MSGLFSKLFNTQPAKSVYKLVLLGDSGVGKSAFFERIEHCTDLEHVYQWKNHNASTHSNALITKLAMGKHSIDLHLIDTMGQEKFGQINEAYLTGADAVIVMYDITVPDTRTNVRKWLQTITTLSQRTRSPLPPVLVCGNKQDKAAKCGPRETYEFRQATLQSIYRGTIGYRPLSVKRNRDNEVWKVVKDLFAFVLKTSVAKIHDPTEALNTSYSRKGGSRHNMYNTNITTSSGRPL